MKYMIYLASDHRGFSLKAKIKEWLTQWGQEYQDMGAFSFDADDDYPDFVHQAAKAVSEDSKRSRGIVLGGSGQGEAMVANRHKGVRAMVYYGGSQEKILDSRGHNDSNVLSLGASFVDDTVKDMIKLWLETPFSGEERHVRRINKIDSTEILNPKH